MHRVGQNRTYSLCMIYDRIFGDFSAKNTVYTPYKYGSGQPYICTVLANPAHEE